MYSARHQTADRLGPASMQTIIISVTPLFAVIFLGYFAAKSRMFDTRAVGVLATFVFTFAMPPMLFRLMATADLAAIVEFRFLGVYLYGELLLFAAGAIFSGWLLRGGLAEMTIQGFGSSFSNGVVIGLPLMLAVFGERGGPPSLLIITLDVFLFSLVTILLEFARAGKSGKQGSAIIKEAGFAVLRNPVAMATALGIVWGLTGFGLTPLIDKTFGFIGQAGPPAGLFALGLSLGLRPIAGGLGPATGMALFKLFAHPAIVWLIATYLIPLDPFWRAAAVLFAACPVGANVFVFAQQYSVGVASSSTAILISTAISMLTITALLLVLLPI